MIQGASAAPSPLPTTPSDSKADTKPKAEEKPTASSSRIQSPTEDGVLSMIDTSLKSPRTAAMDGMVKSLRVQGGDDDDTRDKCVVMLYNALAIDSRAGMSRLAIKYPGTPIDDQNHAY